MANPGLTDCGIFSLMPHYVRGWFDFSFRYELSLLTFSDSMAFHFFVASGKVERGSRKAREGLWKGRREVSRLGVRSLFLSESGFAE